MTWLSLIVFFSVRFIPGDTIDAMLGSQDFGAEGDREALERMLGLDVPAYVQYVRWLGDILLHGSRGHSLVGNRDAVEERIVRKFEYMQQGPWLALLPGLCLTIVVYSLNMFGDAVRDLLDPRLRGGGGRLGGGGVKL